MERSFVVDKVSVDGSALILGAALILLLPFRWLLAVAAAAAVHELFHYLAVTWSGGQVLHIRIRMGGALMEATALPPKQELICAIAGCAGSFLLLVLLPVCPLIAFCGFCQGIFNLLPVYPLDGSRALRCALSMILPDRVVDKLCRGVHIAVVLLVTILFLYWKAYVYAAAMLLGFAFWKKTLQSGERRSTIVLP